MEMNQAVESYAEAWVVANTQTAINDVNTSTSHSENEEEFPIVEETQSKEEYYIETNEEEKLEVSETLGPVITHLPIPATGIKKTMLHCVVEQCSGPPTFEAASGLHTTVEKDGYVSLPSTTLLSELVRAALLQLNYATTDTMTAIGAIQLPNWKLLTFDHITDNLNATIDEMFAAVNASVTLRVRICSQSCVAPGNDPLIEVKDKLLRLLLPWLLDDLVSDGCPIQADVLQSLSTNADTEISNKTRSDFLCWYSSRANNLSKTTGKFTPHKHAKLKRHSDERTGHSQNNIDSSNITISRKKMCYNKNDVTVENTNNNNGIHEASTNFHKRNETDIDKNSTDDTVNSDFEQNNNCHDEMEIPVRQSTPIRYDHDTSDNSDDSDIADNESINNGPISHEMTQHLQQYRFNDDFDRQYELPLLLDWYESNNHPSTEDMIKYLHELNARRLITNSSNSQLVLENIERWFGEIDSLNSSINSAASRRYRTSENHRNVDSAGQSDNIEDDRNDIGKNTGSHNSVDFDDQANNFVDSDSKNRIRYKSADDIYYMDKSEENRNANNSSSYSDGCKHVDTARSNDSAFLRDGCKNMDTVRDRFKNMDSYRYEHDSAYAEKHQNTDNTRNNVDSSFREKSPENCYSAQENINCSIKVEDNEVLDCSKSSISAVPLSTSHINTSNTSNCSQKSFNISTNSSNSKIVHKSNTKSAHNLSNNTAPESNHVSNSAFDIHQHAFPHSVKNSLHNSAHNSQYDAYKNNVHHSTQNSTVEPHPISSNSTRNRHPSFEANNPHTSKNIHTSSQNFDLHTPHVLKNHETSTNTSSIVNLAKRYYSEDASEEEILLQKWFLLNPRPNVAQMSEYVTSLNLLEARSGLKTVVLENIAQWFKNARSMFSNALSGSDGRGKSSHSEVRIKSEKREHKNNENRLSPDNHNTGYDENINGLNVKKEVEKSLDELHKYESHGAMDMDGHSPLPGHMPPLVPSGAPTGPPTGPPAAHTPLNVPHMPYPLAVHYMQMNAAAQYMQQQQQTKLKRPIHPPPSTTPPDNYNDDIKYDRKRRTRVFIDPITEIPKLESWFSGESHPSAFMIDKFCEELNRSEFRRKNNILEPKNIQLWFKNHRAKVKRLKMEFSLGSSSHRY